ncbi:MAG: hypothetical protein R3282_05780 [Rhodothermales bacterium]|nr:hypothetical protein [Rhodothermales bacterium]
MLSTVLFLLITASSGGVAPALPGYDVTPAGVCFLPAPDPPAYYRIDLVPTGRVPGTAQVEGFGDILFSPSPFAVTVTPNGSYSYGIHVTLRNLRYRGEGHFVVWVATSDLRQVRRLGTLDETLSLKGSVDWNKFLLFVTLEPTDEPTERWTGPVVVRGLSRSGLMHTMAGHGPFSREPCATYGY